MQFSANMLNVISKQTPHAAVIIEAAANRVRGLPVQNRVPGFDSVETTLINAMQGMIRDMKQKHQHTTSASPAPSAPAQTSLTASPAPPNTAEAEIQRRLKNFRESMVSALKTKTDKAEIIVDSAINRARGLPHAGKIPGWEEADNLMVKSVTQIIAEARSAHNLKLQNASPTPANTNRTPVSQAQPALRTEPSTSPALARAPITFTGPHMPPSSSISTTPYTAHTPSAPSTHPSGSNVTGSNPPSGARPNMPLQRPAPVALTRPPTTGPIARPTSFHRESTTTSAMPPVTAPAMIRPNVLSPAPPSAGVLDQITGHKRFTDDAFHKAHGVNSSITTASFTGNNNTPLSNMPKIPGTGTAGSLSIIKTVSSGTAASNTTNNLASNVMSTTASKGASHPTSITSNSAGILATNPTNTVSGKTASNPMSSMTTNIASNTISSVATSAASNSISSKPTSVASVPTSSVVSNGPSHSTSNAPINMTSVPANTTPTNISSYLTSIKASNVSSGIMTSQTGIVSSTGNVTLTKNTTTESTSGGTLGVTTGHIPSISTNNPSSNSASKTAPADIANHTTAVTKAGTTGSAAGTNAGLTPSLTPGPTPGEITNTNRTVATSTNFSHATGSHMGGTVGAQNNNNVGKCANSGMGNDKSVLSKVSMVEHHEPIALKVPAPIHNMSGPAPPSAGVVDQIAGHKRSLDEGPGSANAEEPEAKRLGVFPL